MPLDACWFEIAGVAASDPGLDSIFSVATNDPRVLAKAPNLRIQ